MDGSIRSGAPSDPAPAERAHPDGDGAQTTPGRILSPQMVRLLIAAFGSATSLYLLLSVMPLYVTASGSGGAAAGLTTGAMMLATVLTELAVPALLTRYGYRAVLASGLLLLGVPAALLAALSTLPLVLAMCAARGAGLAILVVGGTALVTELVPPQRRGEGLGVYGVAVGAPAVLGLPLGVSLSARVGFAPTFLLAAAVALVELAALPGLPARSDRRAPRVPVLGGLRGRGLVMPALVFATTTFAVGVVVTFLPLAVAGDQHQVIALALLVQAAAAPIARWVAGRYGDRCGPARLLAPALVLTTVGAASLIWVDSALAVLGGMVVFGIGFGAAQYVTLGVMLERVSAAEYSRVSALWNLAYDGGMGAGAIGFGVVVGWTGYPAAFGLTALVILVALVVVLRTGPDPKDRRVGVTAAT